VGENEVVLQKKKIDGEQAKICGENRQVSREEAAKEKREIGRATEINQA